MHVVDQRPARKESGRKATSQDKAADLIEYFSQPHDTPWLSAWNAREVAVILQGLDFGQRGKWIHWAQIGSSAGDDAPQQATAATGGRLWN